MRFERKYRIESEDYQVVLQTMLGIPGAFDYAYPDRWINSIYLDSLDFNALRENLAGISNRNKFRLRWYGEDYQTITKPILEEKIKNNLLGYKRYSSFPDVVGKWPKLESVLDIEVLKNKNLSPVVMVRYKRTYLESFDRQVRITIDRYLQYFAVNNYMLNPFPDEDEAIILEIKYDQEIEESIDYILQSIPFRMTKNSKFVGAMMTHWGK